MSGSSEVVADTGGKSWIVGVILACFASLISNLGINLQKLSHLRQERALHREHLQEMEPIRSENVSENMTLIVQHPASTPASAIIDARVELSSQSYWTQPIWVLGLSLVILGSIADFFALAFAAQIIVAPLGSVTLIANVIFAPLLLGELVTQLEYCSVSLIIIGSIIAVTFASHEDKLYQLEELFALYRKPRFAVFAFIVILVCAAMLFALSKYDQMREDALNQTKILEMDNAGRNTDRSKNIGRNMELQKKKHESIVWTPAYDKYRTQGVFIHRFLYPALSGIIGAQNVLFAKCASELLIDTFTGGQVLFAHLPTYLVLGALGFTIFFQIKYLNEGLRLFEASYVIPVFQSFWCLGSVASGMVFFAEYRSMGRGQILMFSVGIIITISGLLLLSRRKVDASAQGNQSEKSSVILEESLTVHDLSCTDSDHCNCDHESSLPHPYSEPFSPFRSRFMRRSLIDSSFLSN